jgi:hypothetical protein
MKRLLVIVVMACALTIPAAARATAFTVVSDGVTSPAQLARVEAAITSQVATQVSKFWPVTPVTWVASGGMPVRIVPPQEVNGDCGNYGYVGCHTANPASIVIPDSSSSGWAEILDHEILETEVDPSVTGTEICDPVYTIEYLYHGIWFDDWILPHGGDWVRTQQRMSRALMRAHVSTSRRRRRSS